jgi:hypothetical protein
MKLSMTGQEKGDCLIGVTAILQKGKQRDTCIIFFFFFIKI